MMRFFQNFNNGQESFFPIIFNYSPFYASNLPSFYQQNSAKTSILDNQMQNNIRKDCIKKEQGVKQTNSQISAFKTTKESFSNPVFPKTSNYNQIKQRPLNIQKIPTKYYNQQKLSISLQKENLSAEGDADGKILYKDRKRRNWSKQQQEKLKQLVDLFGKHWKHISEHLPNRNQKQIRERYLNYLRSDISNKKWTAEEDEKLLKLVETHGHKWKLMEKKMKKRSQNQLKNRYYGHLLKRKVKKHRPQLDLHHSQAPTKCPSTAKATK